MAGSKMKGRRFGVAGLIRDRSPVPHPRMKSWGQAPALWDSPHPLDSGPVSGYGACFCRSDESGGRIDQMAGRLGHGWGQAPALHFSCDAGLSLLGRRWLVSPAGAGIDPGSESGTCFRANRVCRQAPAHQGMKSRSCGLVQRIGTADSARPHPDPCGGQAPALHILIPPSATGLQVGTFRPLRAGIEVDWRAHPGSESGTCFRTNRSCRLAPAHQGMKKGSGVVCATHPAPSWGQAPALHFSCDAGLSLLGRRWLVSPASAGIHPGSESGTRFRSNRSCLLVPAHQGVKSRSCGLVQRISTADSATPHPDPCGGQAPALHFLIPPSAIGLQFGTFRPWRAGIEVDWRAHPGSESGTCFRANRLCRQGPAHQGMKKGSGVVCATPPAPSWGQAPALRGFPSVPQAGFKPATTVG